MGCVPTKALLHTADVWDHFLNPEADGIQCQNPVLDYPKVIDKKNRIVNKHSKGVEFLLRKNKVEWIKGYARLKGGGRIEVQSAEGPQTLEARNIIIATGSEARMLPGLQPDADLILTNIEILNLTAVPKSLAIIGAGAVGVEFASIFNRFGTEVAVFEMLPRVVPVEDEEISKELDRAFRKAGIRVETGAKVENVRKGGKGVQMTATLASGKTEEVEAEKLLVAVGRRAQHRKHRPGEHARGTGPRLHQGESVPADRRAGRLRHRRRGGGHAATGARGHHGGHGGGGACRGQTGHAHQSQPHSRPALIPSRASAAWV